MDLLDDDLVAMRAALTPPGADPISNDAFERIVRFFCDLATVLAPRDGDEPWMRGG